MHKKEEERRALAEWIANIFGTTPALQNDFWASMSAADIKEIQGDLFYRAYEVVKRIESGLRDSNSILSYMYGHEKLSNYQRVIEKARNEVSGAIRNFFSVIPHRLQYSESPIYVPPLVEQQLIIGQDFAKRKCYEFLKRKGIDPSEYMEYLRERVGSFENPNMEDIAFMNIVKNENTEEVQRIIRQEVERRN